MTPRQWVDALFAACVIILAFDNLLTRKALKKMSQSFDNLNATMTGVETSVAAVQAYVSTLSAPAPVGTPDADIDGVTARLAAVKTTLDAIVPVKPTA